METEAEILANLNDEQKQAVIETEGPILILAGAGSGKTRALTHRIAYLVKSLKVNPNKILAITFTNKAAREMSGRVIRLTGPESAPPWMGTFHSICTRILRAEAQYAFLKNGFLIFDESDQLRLVRECMRETDIDTKLFPPKAVLSEISFAKQHLETPSMLAKRRGERSSSEAACKIYDIYENKLRAQNAVDFDNILCNTVRMFQNHPQIAEKYAERFSYINVDEFQDTNTVQYRLIRILSSAHGNICAVGDDDQSIYSWRGARVENMYDFARDFPGVRIIMLERNYRSTETILDIANAVAREISARREKVLRTDEGAGNQAHMYRAESSHDEAKWIANCIKRQLRNGNKYGDIAVFYRTNSQSRPFEDIFPEQGIPYHIVGGIRFYERAEIKNIVSYLRLIANRTDEISLLRVINIPRRGIGETTMAHLRSFARMEEITLWEAMKSAENVPSIRKGTVSKISMFTKMIDSLEESSEELDLASLIERIWTETGYMEELNAKPCFETQGRIENLMEFQALAGEFSGTSGNGLSAFLEHLSLITDLDYYEEDIGSVTMMTLHNAKGLEFPVVFISGLEEGMLPHARSYESEESMDEERRLFYVGITRAKEELFLSYCEERFRFGAFAYNEPSRFLKSIPESLYVFEDGCADSKLSKRRVFMSENPTKSIQADRSLFGKAPSASVRFFPGERISHEELGEGIIIGLKPSGRTVHLIIRFEEHGEKVIDAGFANIRKL